MAFQSYPPVSPIVSNERRPSGPLWNTITSAIVGLLVLAYIACTAAQLYVLNEAANDATSAASGTPDFTSSSLDALAHRMNTVSDAYQVAFWVMFVTFIIWNSVLRSRLGRLGQTFSRRSLTAWKVWRVGMLVSLAMVFVVRAGAAPTELSDAGPFYHRQMAFYAVRLLVGAAYLWVTYSVWRAAEAAYAASGQTPARTATGI